ncbi:hypothetical protein P3558_24975, partial [Vibrio parahaemolyticus]|nr:hypothetical protein [Vibrio parahaemolyticus]
IAVLSGLMTSWFISTTKMKSEVCPTLRIISKCDGVIEIQPPEPCATFGTEPFYMAFQCVQWFMRQE